MKRQETHLCFFAHYSMLFKLNILSLQKIHSSENNNKNISLFISIDTSSFL